jgi:hypothetical protein
MNTNVFYVRCKICPCIDFKCMSVKAKNDIIKSHTKNFHKDVPADFSIRTINDFDNECCICYSTESLLKSDRCDHIVCAPCFLKLNKHEKGPHCPLCRIYWNLPSMYTFSNFSCYKCNKLYKKPTLYYPILYGHINTKECLKVNHIYIKELNRWIRRDELMKLKTIEFD